MKNFNLFDVVFLTDAFVGLPPGSRGTVVEVFDDGAVEVEFSDEHGIPLLADLTAAVPARRLMAEPYVLEESVLPPPPRSFTNPAVVEAGGYHKEAYEGDLREEKLAA